MDPIEITVPFFYSPQLLILIALIVLTPVVRVIGRALEWLPG